MNNRWCILVREFICLVIWKRTRCGSYTYDRRLGHAHEVKNQHAQPLHGRLWTILAFRLAGLQACMLSDMGSTLDEETISTHCEWQCESLPSYMAGSSPAAQPRLGQVWIPVQSAKHSRYVPCKVVLTAFARCYPHGIPRKWDIVAGLMDCDRILKWTLLANPGADVQQRVEHATEAAELTLDSFHANSFVFLALHGSAGRPVAICGGGRPHSCFILANPHFGQPSPWRAFTLANFHFGQPSFWPTPTLATPHFGQPLL